MARPVLINGRFLTAPATGVQRVARELVWALDRRLVERPGDIEWRLVHPKSVDKIEGLKAIQPVALGRSSGQVWEQVSFGALGREALLVNLANAAPLRAKGTVVMVHDAQVIESPQSYSRAFRTWYRFMLPRVCRRAAQVLTVSHYSAGRLAATGIVDDASRVEVILNGVDHILGVTPSPDILQKNGLGQRPYLLAFASDQPHKNTRALLDMMSSGPADQFDLVLVGSKLPEGMQLPPNVKLTGRTTDADLRALYESAFAFLMPSTTEGYGLPAGEAMLCGAPVIISNAGALVELWGQAASVAASDKPNEWVAAVRELAADPQLRERRQRLGREHAAKFTWAAAAERLRAICERIAKSPA